MFNRSLEGKGLSDDRSPLRLEAAQLVGEALEESDAEARKAIIYIFARTPPKTRAALNLFLQVASFIRLPPPTAAQPAEVQIARLLWKNKGEAMLTRVLATSVERFPGRRRDTSGLLELALGVLDAFRRQMERAAHKPAPLLISAEESITVDQPELKTGSGADGSIAYAVRQQQHLGKRRSRKPTGGFTSSKSEIIEVSDNSDGAKTAGKTDRHGGGAYPAAYGARSSQAEEECGDNFSTDQRQAAGAFVAGTVSTASMCGGD